MSSDISDGSVLLTRACEALDFIYGRYGGDSSVLSGSEKYRLRERQTANASTLSNSKRYGNVRRKNCMLVDTIRTIWLLVPTFTGAFPNVTQFVLLGDALD